MERDAPQSTPPATLCKAGCGFYGSPNFDSMCSKCFKEALKKKNQNPSQNASPSGTPSPSSTSATLLGTATASTAPLQTSVMQNPAAPLQSSSSSGATAASAVPLPTSLETGTPTIPIVSPAAGSNIVICSSNSFSSSCSSGASGLLQQSSPLYASAVSASPSGAGGGGHTGSESSNSRNTPSIPGNIASIPDDGVPEATGGLDDSSIVDGSSDDGEKDGKKPKKNRCHECRKKVGLTGFECRCGGLYCSLHRYSDKHKCSFDYHALGAEQIRKANPVVVSEKVQKI